MQALSIVAPPDDPPEALEVESQAVRQPEPVLDEIGLAVTQARRRRGHRMKPSSAAFVAEGIRAYCATLKIAPDLDIITAAAEACSPNGKEAVLNAVKNTFACIKAQSMPLIQISPRSTAQSPSATGDVIFQRAGRFSSAWRRCAWCTWRPEAI